MEYDFDTSNPESLAQKNIAAFHEVGKAQKRKSQFVRTLTTNFN